MVVVHGTKKFLDWVGRACVDPAEASTTRLGSWCATVLFWPPQVALFVSETTPVLLTFAPAATVLARLPGTLERVLADHGVGWAFIDDESPAMSDIRLAKTANRSVVGVVNEFTYLAGAYAEGQTTVDLDGLSLRLAHTPCGPLYRTHISPGRALAAAVTDAETARPTGDRAG